MRKMADGVAAGMLGVRALCVRIDRSMQPDHEGFVFSQVFRMSSSGVWQCAATRVATEPKIA